jgi:exo-beta-1,3-glucanase (GH17 family)
MLNYPSFFGVKAGQAVCYSGYRRGQRPGEAIPSRAEVLEDLVLVAQHFDYIRLYSIDDHTEMVLDILSENQIDLKVMIGAYLEAEVNNPNCGWDSGVYSEEVLLANRDKNQHQVQALIRVAEQYSDLIFALAVGNEACVSWTDHLVPVEQIIKYLTQVKNHCHQPVTVCDNYVPWLGPMEPLVACVDFIAIHSYPAWEYTDLDQALSLTQSDLEKVTAKYPNKPVVITEAGWPTRANGKGIPVNFAHPMAQKTYFQAISRWAKKQEVLVFWFEAFDEPWKGSEDPDEPEKHWGLYTVDRMPKRALTKGGYKP